MEFDELKEIELADRGHISGIYNRYGKGDSAHSFESLYIWKEEMNLKVLKGTDFYAIREKSRKGSSWFFPVGETAAKEQFIRSLLDKGDVRFFYMTGEDVDFLEKSFPGCFAVTETPDSSEYIIDRETMSELPGSSFSKDRGHINKLVREHEIETVSVRDVEKKDLYDIILGWDVNKHIYEEIPDRMATKNIISHMEELNIEGIVLVMDGTPVSVCAGFNLNESTVDCVIQKNRISQQGLTYYLRQQYARTRPDAVRFFNWEEDLGIEGLRRAKILMRPSTMITMYSARSNEKNV